MVPRGMVQGGDPLSKDPAKRDGLRHRRPERGEGRCACAEDDQGIGGGGDGAWESPTAPARSSSSCSPISPRSTASTPCSVRCRTAWRCCMKISATPVDAGGLATERVEIRRVTIRDTPPEPFVTETVAGARRVPRGARHERGADHDRVLHRQGAQHGPSVHAAWRPPASTTAWRFIASRPALSFRPARRAPAPPPFTEKQQKLVAAARPGVQRHQAREGDRVDGARRRAGQRDDVVLHLHRHVDGARRSVHGLRPRRRRDGGGRGDRKSAARTAKRRSTGSS